MKFHRSAKETAEKPLPPPPHNPALDRSRIGNLLDVEVLLEKAAPSIAHLALQEAIEISLDRKVRLNDIIVERYFLD